MHQEGKVPQSVKAKVAEAVDLLNRNGIDYEQTLVEQNLQAYNFLFPKNQYYKYYTHYLFEHGPTSRERMRQAERHERRVEGNIETISVGAMSEILKEQLRQGHQPYTPLANQIYQHQFAINLADNQLQQKIKKIQVKYKELNAKKKTAKLEKANLEKNTTKHQNIRKELGANADGSMGVYGGKKYQGLGSRDQFSTFRREQSQSYYSSLQQKLRQG